VDEGTDVARRFGTTLGRRRAALATIAAALLVVGPATAGSADPSNPSQQDVQAAQQAVVTAQMSVADMEVRLAQLSVQRDAAAVAVERAGQVYAQAQETQQAATDAATRAAAQSVGAAAQAESARRMLVAIARESARSGGSIDTIEAVLSSDGIQQVVDRTTALSQVGTKADEAVQTFKAAQLVATTLAKRSAAAVTTQATATAAAKDALAAAQKTQAASDASVAAAATERDGLIAQLAVAQNTSAAIEKARQDQIDAQRQARADAAAQAQRLAAATPIAASTKTSTTTPRAAPPSTVVVPVNNPQPPAPSTPRPPTGTVPPSPPPATSNGSGTGTSNGSSAQGAAAVAWALARVGTPYVWGGTGPNGFDCSGLTMRAWQAAGVSLNRTAADQYVQIQKISYNALQPGDLIFYSSNVNDPSQIYHVAMWIGGNQMVEAPSAGQTVHVTPMRWASSMPYAGRP
jgi:cell wall-associated NlpC family hydrolase